MDLMNDFENLLKEGRLDGYQGVIYKDDADDFEIKSCIIIEDSQVKLAIKGDSIPDEEKQSSKTPIEDDKYYYTYIDSTEEQFYLVLRSHTFVENKILDKLKQVYYVNSVVDYLPDYDMSNIHMCFDNPYGLN